MIVRKHFLFYFSIILFYLFFILKDIASVRDNTAIALGNYIRAYKDEVIPKIKQLLTENIPKALDQPIDSHINQNMANETIFGVSAKKAFVSFNNLISWIFFLKSFFNIQER